MGCGCKKNKYETKVIKQTPEPIPTPQVIKLPELNDLENGTRTEREDGQSEASL